MLNQAVIWLLLVSLCGIFTDSWPMCNYKLSFYYVAGWHQMFVLSTVCFLPSQYVFFNFLCQEGVEPRTQKNCLGYFSALDRRCPLHTFISYKETFHLLSHMQEDMSHMVMGCVDEMCCAYLWRCRTNDSGARICLRSVMLMVKLED